MEYFHMGIFVILRVELDYIERKPSAYPKI